MSRSATAVGTVELRNPFLWYSSGNNVEADECLDWTAQAAMFADGEESEVLRTVPVGTLDFAVLRLDEGVPIVELLDELGDEALPFEEAFVGDVLSTEAEMQFGWCHTVLLLLDARIAGEVRGRGLGAWLAAEVCARFASPGTIVLGWPHPVGIPEKGRGMVEAEDALMNYWTWVGLEPLNGAPHLIGQSTHCDTLSSSRKVLRERLDGVRISVPSDSAILS